MYIAQIHTGIFHLHFSIKNKKYISPINETMWDDFMYITIWR